MSSKVLEYFRDKEDNEPSFIRMTRNVLFFVMAITAAILPLVTGIAGKGSENTPAFVILTTSLIIEGIALLLVLRGRVRMAKVIVPMALIVAITTIALTTNGLRDISIVALPITLVVGALLLGRRALWIITPLAVLAAEIIAVTDLNSARTATHVGVDDAIIIATLLIGCSGIIQLLINRFNESIQRAQESERNSIEQNRELIELRSTLESRVNQRTRDLESANENNERRARQFEAVAQVARVISNIQDLETLLPRIAQVISDQFGHYHTGIFLLEDAGEYAVFRGTNSVGGRKMLARGHKLLVGQTGIVGSVTATGQPRIALNLGSDTVYFDNPDLPNTRSEIALPLRIAGEIIGALDVQSEEENAFKQDDIAALSTLADQASIAIQNTRAFEDARSALVEAQSAYGESVREAWKVMRPQTIGTGIQLVDSTIKPLENPSMEQYARAAVEQDRTTTSLDRIGTLAIPIRMRGKVIGVMSLKNNSQVEWTEDDVDIAEAVAERLSLAIETVSLLRTAQHRAEVERITTEISTKIGSSSRFETIMQTAAQELSKALGGSDVLVQIEPVALKLGITE